MEAQPKQSASMDADSGIFFFEPHVDGLMNIGRKAERSELIKEGRETPIQHLVPAGFTQVVDGIYRSGCPTILHLDIFEVLNIKTICSLTHMCYDFAVKFWVIRNKINRAGLPMLPNDSKGVHSPYADVDRLLGWIIRPENHPLVFHCDQGSRQAACLVGCFRVMQGWDAQSIIREYREYSKGDHDGSLDEEFILNYHPSPVLMRLADKLKVASWRPEPSRLTSNAPSVNPAQ